MDISSDYHVHCGQYEQAYYQPAFVIRALHAHGIKNVWLSSTTSNIIWNNKTERDLLVQHVEEELLEAINTALEVGINVTPLYWVIPQRFLDGESIISIMNSFPYGGFKIHPRSQGWGLIPDNYVDLMQDICKYAATHNMPILIHSGVDPIDSPCRFEKYFSQFPTVKFVLAHCRETSMIIRLFSQYDNVLGDYSFCPKSSVASIQKAGFISRMQLGTDFPITHWYENRPQGSVPLSDLIDNYATVCFKARETFSN